MSRMRIPVSSLPASVRLVEPAGELPRLEISTPAAEAEVFFHGAHLTHWRPVETQQPVLWVSSRAIFREDKGIRGGVPICFPWFAAHPTEKSAPSHGFVRTREWTLTEASEAAGGRVMLVFALEVNESDSPFWPHRCRASYRLSIGTTLEMALEVQNVSEETFSFEEALHTYFRISDIERVSIIGLEGTDYLDKVQGFARRRQSSDPIHFAGETDRVYLDTTTTCRIADEGWSRQLVVRKSGSRTTVVWNPWAEGAPKFPDIGPGEWRQMVCVETANAGDGAIRLAPGQSHVMHAELLALG